MSMISYILIDEEDHEKLEYWPCNSMVKGIIAREAWLDPDNYVFNNWCEHAVGRIIDVEIFT